MGTVPSNGEASGREAAALPGRQDQSTLALCGWEECPHGAACVHAGAARVTPGPAQMEQFGPLIDELIFSWDGKDRQDNTEAQRGRSIAARAALERAIREAIERAPPAGLADEQIEGVKHIKAMAAARHDHDAIYAQACAILGPPSKGEDE